MRGDTKIDTERRKTGLLVGDVFGVNFEHKFFTKEDHFMAEKKGVSLKPSDQVEGGGLLDNVDCLWKEVRFEMFDYGGTQAETPALRVTIAPEDGGEVDQYWSCGQAKDWNPSKDGKSLIPVGEAKGLNKSSNASILFQSLIKANFPEDKIGDDVSVFEGMRAHMIRVPAPKRGGLPSTKKREDGREFEKTILVVDKILSLPGEEKAEGKPKADGKLADTTAEAIVAILSENPKGMDKMKLIGALFTHLKKGGMGIADVNAATRLVREDAVDGPWKVEGGIYSM